MVLDEWLHREADAALEDVFSRGFERAQFAVLTAHRARRLSKQLGTREGWEKEQEEALFAVCMAKYSQNLELAQKLLETGDMQIIYDTTGTHDNEMGRCACEACAQKEAKNLYGRTLMRVREALRKSGGA